MPFIIICTASNVHFSFGISIASYIYYLALSHAGYIFFFSLNSRAHVYSYPTNTSFTSSLVLLYYVLPYLSSPSLFLFVVTFIFKAFFNCIIFLLSLCSNGKFRFRLKMATETNETDVIPHFMVLEHFLVLILKPFIANHEIINLMLKLNITRAQSQ